MSASAAVIDHVRLPAEDRWPPVPARSQSESVTAALTRLLMSTGPDGRDVSIGRDEQARLWIYSASSGRAVGEVDGPLCVLPSPVDGHAGTAPHCVMSGLTEAVDASFMVVVDCGAESVPCRVHEHMWVSLPIPFTIGTRPHVRWEDRERRTISEFRMGPFAADMMSPGTITYAPLS